MLIEKVDLFQPQEVNLCKSNFAEVEILMVDTLIQQKEKASILNFGIEA